MTELKKTSIRFHFGIMDIYSNYVIMVMNEGETVIPEYNDELVKVSETYFKNKPFAYITHRKYSYAVDPQIYIETSKIENLVAFAVVSKEQLTISNTEVEKLFMKKPVQVFDTLGNAIDWVESVVANWE